MEMPLTLAACTLILISGLPGLFASRRAAWGQITATALVLSGSLIGLASSFAGLATGRVCITSLPGIWPGWPLHLRMDGLSAFFAVLIFLMAAVGSVYGHGYWRQREHPTTGRKLRLLYGVMLTAMVVVTLANDAFAFLLAWEIMALTSYFLIATEDHKPECRQAAWVYFVATHIGTLALFAMFALLHEASGTFLLSPIPARTCAGLKTAIFLLALLGFGLKAGIMPLHFWLPGAHANAPSHISALLSGVLLKVGIYGLLRVLTLMPDPPAVWGVIILLLGGLSAFLGVAFALGQHDIKRLLAYHSIENIGIIFMGLGLALIGVAAHRPVWVVLGIAGCLLHVWNHGLFKSLLFLSAGSVVHSTGTRDIDSLGGLAGRMPWSAGLFMMGSVAICGLPPLNGFISELLVYVGLLTPVTQNARGWSSIALGAVVLAVVGALAVACFVKVFGAVFLGTSRTALTQHARECPWSMKIPMLILALWCAVIGVAPMLAVLPLGNAASVWIGHSTGAQRLHGVIPWGILTAVNVCFAAVLLVAFAAVRLRRRAIRSPRRATWACGYVRPTSRMQYTAVSFAQMLVTLLALVLRPLRHGAVGGAVFPPPTEVESHVPDFITDHIAFRCWRKFKEWMVPVRMTHKGNIQQYLLYFLLILIALMCSLVPLWSLVNWVMGR